MQPTAACTWLGEIFPPLRTGAGGIHDIQAKNFRAPQAQGHCAQKADGAEAGHEAAACKQPIGGAGGVGQAGDLHAHGFVNGFFHDRKRFGQYAEGFQFGWDAHDILLFVHDELSLVAVFAPDAAFVVFAGEAHIGTVHGAGQALAAAAPDGEDSVIPGFDALDCRAGLDHLAEHFVADDQIGLAAGQQSAASGGFFAVGAADADPVNAGFQFVRGGELRFGTIDQAGGCCAGNDGDGFHSTFLSTWNSSAKFPFSVG